MDNNNKILVGKIVAMQGVQGDVRVQTYTENPLDFKNLKVWSEIFGADDFHFVRAVPSSDIIIAHIRGYDDRTSAEHLRGTSLFVDRAALPDNTQDNEYYQADLIGFNVIQNGKNVGSILCFQNFGAGDIIETEDGNMYSFKGALVDFDKKTVTVK